MPTILIGGSVKTTVHQIEYHWPTKSAFLNAKLWSEVGVWVGKNERFLNRKDQATVAQELADTFPDMDEVVVRDYAGKSAKWRRA